MGRLIEADALLREFDPDDPEDGMYNILARGKIVQAPTVDAEPVVHGHWIETHDPIKDPKAYFVRITCSACGLITGQRSTYCPNCGAHMDGQRKDTRPAPDSDPVRHGQWLESANGDALLVCSECGSEYDMAVPNYCPHCGCKMDGQRKDGGEKA